MDKFKFSTKHVAIDKSSAQSLIAVSVATFIIVFSLIASHSVLTQYHYQSRVIGTAKKADTQLKNDLIAYDGLAREYVKFNAANPNVIGNQVTGTSNNNTQVVLNALPGEYDYPALITSLYYILSATGVSGSVTSSTDQTTQSSRSTSTTSVVPISFSYDISNTDTGGATKLLQYLQQSSRPLPIDSMTINGDQGNLKLSITAHTYFQPSKTLTITQQAVN